MSDKGNNDNDKNNNKKPKSGGWKTLRLIFAATAVGIGGLNLYGLSDQKSAEKVIKDDGRFTSAEYKGHKAFACGSGDLWRDEFRAVNKDGQKVDIVVCQGVFKGGTVRIL